MVTEQSVSASMNQLVGAINKLTELVKTAAEEMHEEPNKAMEEKLDKLISQNEDISRSLLLLLELNRQHLPSIATNTKKQPQPPATPPSDFESPFIGFPPEFPKE